MAKAKKKTKSPGVVASIIEFLTKASKTRPLTKDQLLAKLAKRFPDRAESSMLRTINCQVPNRLWTDKEIEVQKNDKKPAGYWIAK